MHVIYSYHIYFIGYILNDTSMKHKLYFFTDNFSDNICILEQIQDFPSTPTTQIPTYIAWVLCLGITYKT